MKLHITESYPSPGLFMHTLADLSGGAKQSAVQKMFSSHPDDGKRVARAKALAEKYSKTQSKKK